MYYCNYIYCGILLYIIAFNIIIDLTIIAIIVKITIIFNVNDCCFCVFRQAAIS
jgi:hypothetical protein